MYLIFSFYIASFLTPHLLLTWIPARTVVIIVYVMMVFYKDDSNSLNQEEMEQFYSLINNPDTIKEVMKKINEQQEVQTR